MQLLLKIVGVLVLVYIIWLATGGVERGEERRALDEDALFIELEGTALDEEDDRSRININRSR